MSPIRNTLGAVCQILGVVFAVGGLMYSNSSVWIPGVALLVVGGQLRGGGGT